MAKAKKTESTDKPKAAAKKPAAKSTSTAATDTPMIDTALAAQNAARMLVAGFNKPVGTGNTAESAMFKQLKAGMNKPGSTHPLLNAETNANLNKSTGGFKPNQQSANYSANVARTGVPRRNPG